VKLHFKQRLLGILPSLNNLVELSFFFSMMFVKFRHVLPCSIICWLSTLCCNMMTVLNDSSSGVRLGILMSESFEVRRYGVR
jgi:hypothetical protein